MPGPKTKYPIQLAESERTKLQHLIRAHQTPQAKATRAKIVFLAAEHPDWSNQRIAQEVGYTDRAVRKWRRRWVETKNLEDLPRPGAPKRFSP